MRSYRFKLAGFAAATVFAGLSAPVGAQDSATSFQLEHFEPLPAQETNLGNLAGSGPLESGRASVGLTMHFVDDPLQVRTNGEVTDQLVDDQFKSEITGAISLWGYGDFGVALPLVLAQSTGDLGVLDVTEEASSFALGDIRLVPRVRMVKPEWTGGVGAALLVPLYLPTGDTGSFNGEGGVRVEPRLAVDWSHGSGLRVLGNVGYQLRDERVALSFVSDDILRWGLGVETPVGFDGLHATASLFGQQTFADGRDTVDHSLAAPNVDANPMEALFGVRIDAPANLLVSLGGGAGLTSDVGSPDFRLFAGIEWSPKLRGDKDKDGVSDGSDNCVDEPEDIDGFEDEDGCPEWDNDGDNIDDLRDPCPLESEDWDGFEDTDGCPDKDNDKDGVPDDEDRCINEPGEAFLMGCPVRDTDGDAVPDHEDACVEQPEDIDGFADEDGCPEWDNDGDGLADDVDACPTDAEIINGKDDNDGCPDEGKSSVAVSPTGIQVLEPIEFDSRARVQRKSRKVLDQVAAVLQNRSLVKSIKIEASVAPGADEAADLLSATKRAEAVRDYLVERGVDLGRLEAHGAGRAADGAERVSFAFGEVEEPPTPAPSAEPEGGDEAGGDEAEGEGGFDFTE